MSGAIWTNKMPQALLNGLQNAGVGNATTLAKDVYGNPVAWIKKYPVGTLERHAVEGAYRQVQRYICIAGMCITALLFVISLGLKNPKLGDTQSLGLDELEGIIEPPPKKERVNSQENQNTASSLSERVKSREG